MKKIIFLFLFISTMSFAALPPFYQSSKEIKAILNSPDLHEKLGSGQYILDIIKTRSGWMIITPKYRLPIEVKYIPQERIGPAEFELEFGSVIDISN